MHKHIVKHIVVVKALVLYFGFGTLCGLAGSELGLRCPL
jgi:hypothetical protein